VVHANAAESAGRVLIHDLLSSMESVWRWFWRWLTRR
jgi:hypothetical protein